MSHEMIISGGTVVDGSGADGFKADVAIDNGKISRIGDLKGEQAAKTIDATDRIVTPGFVDLHTHLDAQVGWDPQMSSSSYHGVTTALIGNCGVTFAPVTKKNHRYLAELMEAVEDIAADAIMDGLPWNWESYGEYLDCIETLNPALNVVGLVGHSAVRLEAMGDKSMDEGVQPDDKELEHITQMVKQSLEEGAVGFSTSRFLQHTVPDGRCTPGTWADLRETQAIQRAVIEGGGTGALFQSANDMATRFETEKEMFRQGTRAYYSNGQAVPRRRCSRVFNLPISAAYRPRWTLYSRNLGRPERNSGHTKSRHRRRRYWRSISISQRHGDSLRDRKRNVPTRH